MEETKSPDFTNTKRKHHLEEEEVRHSTSSSSTSTSRDFISELPEPLLHHILSFLDMTWVVQTSLLSRRWRYLWPSLNNLNFNLLEFLEWRSTMKANNQFLFNQFLENVLLFRDGSNIHTFNLFSDSRSCNISKWISVAAWRDVQEIDLQARHEEVPNCLFTCKSLRTLKLDMNMREGEWDIPDSICLPVLKTLHIKSIRFSGGERISKLFSTCPVLEILIISQCVLTKPGDISISAFHLNKLVIEELDSVDDYDDLNQNSKITVCTPNLTSFTCKEYAPKDYTLLNFSSRVNAIIHVSLAASFYDWESSLEFSPSMEQEIQIVIKFLKGLCSVRSLTVDVWLLEAIFELPAPASLRSLLSPFYNLTFLKLSTSLSRYRIHTVTGFLGKCPNLETLVLEMAQSPIWNLNDKSERRKRITILENGPGAAIAMPCMEYHLKFVEIRDATGSVNELEFLKFVLKNAMVLEQITIAAFKEQSPSERRQKRLMRLRKEIVTFPKASSSIKISFL